MFFEVTLEKTQKLRGEEEEEGGKKEDGACLLGGLTDRGGREIRPEGCM